MAEIPLFPLNTVLFPGATLPLFIFEERYKLMVGRCVERDTPFGVVLIRSGQEVGGPAEPFEIGTTARIAHVERLADGRLQIITVGAQRFRIRDQLHGEPYMSGIVEMLSDEEEDAAGIAEAVERVGSLFTEYARLTIALADGWTRRFSLPKRPGALADYVAARLQLEPRTKQRLLEELSVPRRLALERRLLENGIELLAAQLQAVRRIKFGGFGVLN